MAITNIVVKNITDWPKPTTKKQLKGFIGLASFCRQFIQDFSHIFTPLKNLNLEKRNFIWTSKEKKLLKKKNTLIIYIQRRKILCSFSFS